MLKHFLVFLIYVVTALSASAQDTLVMRNGDQLLVKIEVIDVSEISYRKFDNLNGPLHIVAKADVFMVKYQNGTHDVFSSAEAPLATPPTTTTHPPRDDRHVRDNRDTRDNHRRYRNYEQLHKMAASRTVAGAVITSVGVVFLASGITLTATEMQAAMNRSRNSSMERAIAGTLLTIAGIPCSIIGPILLGRGAKYRRQAQEMGPALGFSPVINDVNLERYNYTGNQTNIATVSIIF